MIKPNDCFELMKKVLASTEVAKYKKLDMPIMNKIVYATFEFFGEDYENRSKRGKKQSFVIARQLSCHIAMKEYGIKSKALAPEFNRDSSTIRKGRIVCDGYLETDYAYRKLYRECFAHVKMRTDAN